MLLKNLNLLVISLFLFSCGNNFHEESIVDNSINNELKKYDLLLPRSIEKIPHDPNNKLSYEKIELGKFLFHDNRLAMNPKNINNLETYSCASCHDSRFGFSSGNIQGVGEGASGVGIQRISSDIEDDFQNLKSPTILNTAYQKNTLWNGKLGHNHHNKGLDHLFIDDGSINNELGFEGVETQAVAGLKVHRLIDETNDLNNSFLNSGTYLKLYNKAFPDEELSFINIALAIAAYERSVLSNEAPFQKYLRNEVDLSLKEKRGLKIFLTKGQCISCHNGPSLSDGNFHRIGFKDFPSELMKNSILDLEGRSSFTNNYLDLYKFKTPQLYNLKDRHSFGHGGSFSSLKELVKYKNKAISENSRVNILDIKPLNLTNSEIDDLVYFLEESLYDENINRYVPIRNP